MVKITWPNRITITRIILIGPFVIALLKLQEPQYGELARYSAVALFILMAISDGLDGYLARKLNQESQLGRFLDPLADKLLIMFSVLLLANDDTCVTGAKLPPTIAVIAIGKDIYVTFGFCIIYFITSELYIEPRAFGKWCTTMQLAMVIAVLVSPDLPPMLSRLPNVLWWAASALAGAAIIQYFQLARHFLEQHESNLTPE